MHNSPSCEKELSSIWASCGVSARRHVLPFHCTKKFKKSELTRTKNNFFLIADFPELNEEQLKDETTELRFNRQIYDFFQSMNVEPWLKPYTPFFESYFLMCRATKIIPEGTKLMYPFIKVGALVSELRKLEGSYFNPRKLSEITTLAFNSGAQV